VVVLTPCITIVPGFTPPIKEPDGKLTASPDADILASPI
jgi:hypothetical protein